MKNLYFDKPLFSLTAGEFLELLKTIGQGQPSVNTEKTYVYGISGIARLFNCSTATAARIKASGKIDRAIMQAGRKIVIDAALALELFGEKGRKATEK